MMSLVRMISVVLDKFGQFFGYLCHLDAFFLVAAAIMRPTRYGRGSAVYAKWIGAETGRRKKGSWCVIDVR